MIKRLVNQSLIYIVAILTIVSCTTQKDQYDFTFIVISDQRSHATEIYHSKEYTLGGLEAIKDVGQGEFIIVNGDLDPPQATRELLDTIFGTDYPWYTVIGNHDIQIEENLEFLRNLNRNGNTFDNIVKRGPAGCEETTYSFDHSNVHFVVLNLYYDGEKDNVPGGEVSPELLAWLEEDLKLNNKKFTFIFGHEPIRPVMDMENGTIRHIGNALDQYYESTILFERILNKYDVDAYFSGHVHSASYANHNGLWLINSGHLYGQESDFTPAKLFDKISKEVAKTTNKGKSYKNIIKELYYKDYDTKEDYKEYKKLVFNLGYGDGWDYKNTPDDVTLNKLYEFYAACKDNDKDLQKYEQLFWDNTEWRKSTFLKIKIRDDFPVVEFYRDKDYYGNYELTQTIILN